jgi:glycosyltransferase involved in cell wall biosynthesis
MLRAVSSPGREIPDVSVLVPCFNKAGYIEETLASVYAQAATSPAAAARADKGIEIIVVDDGSTDGSVAVLERHRDRCMLILGPNRGASAARQTALCQARGRYIAYLDADDLLLPDALARLVGALETSGGDVAYGAFQRYVRGLDGGFTRGETVARRWQDVDPDVEIACFTRFWLPPAALLYRHALLERMPPWNPALPVIQDARYLQEAAFAGARFTQVREVVALYREDASNSLSKRSALAFARDVYRNALEVEELWRLRGALGEGQRRALGDTLENAARMLFREDDALFDACCERIRALDVERPLGWPSIAERLRKTLGKDAALRALALMRKPAQ